jgi:transposase
MEAAAYRAAKAQVVEQMLQGHPWHEAVVAAGLGISRSTAYQLLKRVRAEGEAALIDGRHGHATKLRAPLRHWLKEYWRDHQEATCREAQAALEARYGVRVSQSHLSRVRTASPSNLPPPERGGKRRRPHHLLSRPGRREWESAAAGCRPRDRLARGAGACGASVPGGAILPPGA